MKRLIKCPTYVLASFPDKFSKSGVVDAGISDHQLIYCTRKTARIKSYCHKQITFRSLKNYSADVYEKALIKLSFPDYELFDGIEKACENFIQKTMAVIDNLAFSKNNSWKK